MSKDCILCSGVIMYRSMYRVPKMLTGIVARVAYVILEKVHDKCLLYQGTTDHIVTCVHELTCVRIADTHLLCYAIY